MQYSCAKENSLKNWTVTDSQSLTECGYTAGDIVHCEVEAATVIGFGPSNALAVNVECDSKWIKILTDYSVRQKVKAHSKF